MHSTREAATLAGLSRALFTQRLKGFGLKPAGRVRRRHPGHPQNLFHKTVPTALLLYPLLRTAGVTPASARELVRAVGSMSDEAFEHAASQGREYAFVAGPHVAPELYPLAAIDRAAAERGAVLDQLGFRVAAVNVGDLWRLVTEGAARIAQATEAGHE